MKVPQFVCQAPELEGGCLQHYSHIDELQGGHEAGCKNIVWDVIVGVLDMKKSCQ